MAFIHLCPSTSSVQLMHDTWTVVLFCFVLFWKSMYQSAVRSFGIHSTSIFFSCFKICLPATPSPSLHYFQLFSSLSRPSLTNRTLEPSILSAYRGVYVLLVGQEEAWILSQMLPQQSISSHQSFQPEKKRWRGLVLFCLFISFFKIELEKWCSH